MMDDSVEVLNTILPLYLSCEAWDNRRGQEEEQRMSRLRRQEKRGKEIKKEDENKNNKK